MQDHLQRYLQAHGVPFIYHRCHRNGSLWKRPHPQGPDPLLSPQPLPQTLWSFPYIILAMAFLSAREVMSPRTLPSANNQGAMRAKGQHSLELPHNSARQLTPNLTCCGERDAAVCVLGTLPLALGGPLLNYGNDHYVPHQLLNLAFSLISCIATSPPLPLHLLGTSSADIYRGGGYAKGYSASNSASCGGHTPDGSGLQAACLCSVSA